jgi:hypothetical protein
MAISKKEIENRVNALVAKGYSKEEAETLVQEDIIIDTGGSCDWEDDFTDEQMKVSRQARQADREVSKTPAKRKRAEDWDKRHLIGCLCHYLTEEDQNNPSMVDDLVVLNPEREIEFHYHGRKFKLTLSAPRPPKD